MANQTFDAARTVLAIREYDDRPVPGDVVQRIVEAARMTASGQNKQPWHFVVVRDRATLEELGRRVRTGPYIHNAPMAVVAAVEKDNPLGLSDVSRAIQTMMLVAWAEGVGSNWTGFRGMEPVAELVGLPDHYQVVAVVPFGYPTRAVKGRKQRKPLAEVASAERYGQPFS